jgi:hypothetical protein
LCEQGTMKMYRKSVYNGTRIEQSLFLKLNGF